MNYRIYPDFESITSSNQVSEECIHINASKNMKGTPQRQEEVSIYSKHWFFAVYTRYIPRIYLSWCLSWTLSGQLCLPASLGSLRPGILADPLRFGHRQTTNARLGGAQMPRAKCWSRQYGCLSTRHAPSAHPHSQAVRCQLAYLWGIVEVALQSRKHSMREPLPRRSSTLPT